MNEVSPNLNGGEYSGEETLRMDRGTLSVLSAKCSEAAILLRELTSGQEGKPSFICEESLLHRLHLTGQEWRYTDEQEIGEGSNAKVYSLHDLDCNREVAVKVLKHASETEEIRRFVVEAGVVANLEHPSIVPVYDLACDISGQVYLSMRKVQGRTLKDFIEETLKAGASCDEIVRIFLKICDALSYAHSKGHTHQDIKPENIMLGEYGEVFVIDWGASASSGSDEISLTPMYMSPQQANGQEAAVTDDVFCLGATLFHCLTGRFPTTAESLLALWEKRRRGIIDPLTDEQSARAPAALISIATKAMSLDSRERYQTITEFADDLKSYQAGLSVTAHSDTLLQFIKRFYQRHRNLVHVAGLLLAFGIAGGAWMYRQHQLTLSGWTEEVDTLLNTPAAVSRHVEKLQHNLKPAGALDINEAGVLVKDHRLWVKGRYPGDVRIVITFSYEDPKSIDGFDVIFSARRGELSATHQRNPSYVVQAGGFGGTVCFLARIDRASFAGDEIAVTSFHEDPDNQYTLVVEREGEDLRATLNGEELFEDTDPLPLIGNEFCRIGFRTWNDIGVRIRSLAIESRRRALYSSPLEPADTLLKRGYAEDAFEEYVELAEKYPIARIRERAFAKSVVTAHQLRKFDVFLERLKRFSELFPESRFAPRLLEYRILYHWSRSDIKTVLRLLNTIDDHEAHGLVLNKLLGVTSFAIPEQDQSAFLEHIARHTEWQSINLGDFDLISIEPLKGMRLQRLSISNNRITSLEPLSEMPLEIFDCSDNPITDLSPIANAPMKRLNADNTLITELPNFPNLDTLDVHKTNIHSVESLRNSPLLRLNIGATNVTDLSPLRGKMTVTSLKCEEMQRKIDLTILPSLKLSSFELGFATDQNASFDVRSLAGSQESLRNLSLERCRPSHATEIGRFPTLLHLKLKRTGLANLSFLEGSMVTELEISGSPDLSFLSKSRIRDLSLTTEQPIDLRPLAESNVQNLRLKLTRAHDREIRSLMMLLESRNQDLYRQVARYYYLDIEPDAEKLRNVGFVINGHHYVTKHSTTSYSEAKKLAESLGAHIITLETEEELDALARVSRTHTWLGLEKDANGNPTWITGIPLSWHLPYRTQPNENTPYRSTFLGQKVFYADGVERSRSVILEWDD